jgi:hypothetical protein
VYCVFSREKARCVVKITQCLYFKGKAMKDPTITFGVANMHLYKKDMLTVWLHTEDETPPIQVELRVTNKGTPEIFLDKSNIVKQFINWYLP